MWTSPKTSMRTTHTTGSYKERPVNRAPLSSDYPPRPRDRTHHLTPRIGPENRSPLSSAGLHQPQVPQHSRVSVLQGTRLLSLGRSQSVPEYEHAGSGDSSWAFTKQSDESSPRLLSSGSGKLPEGTNGRLGARCAEERSTGCPLKSRRLTPYGDERDHLLYNLLSDNSPSHSGPTSKGGVKPSIRHGSPTNRFTAFYQSRDTDLLEDFERVLDWFRACASSLQEYCSNVTWAMQRAFQNGNGLEIVESFMAWAVLELVIETLLYIDIDHRDHRMVQELLNNINRTSVPAFTSLENKLGSDSQIFFALRCKRLQELQYRLDAVGLDAKILADTWGIFVRALQPSSSVPLLERNSDHESKAYHGPQASGSAQRQKPNNKVAPTQAIAPRSSVKAAKPPDRDFTQVPIRNSLVSPPPTAYNAKGPPSHSIVAILPRSGNPIPLPPKRKFIAPEVEDLPSKRSGRPPLRRQRRLNELDLIPATGAPARKELPSASTDPQMKPPKPRLKPVQTDGPPATEHLGGPVTLPEEKAYDSIPINTSNSSNTIAPSELSRPQAIAGAERDTLRKPHLPIAELVRLANERAAAANPPAMIRTRTSPKVLQLTLGNGTKPGERCDSSSPVFPLADLIEQDVMAHGGSEHETSQQLPQLLASREKGPRKIFTWTGNPYFSALDHQSVTTALAQERPGLSRRSDLERSLSWHLSPQVIFLQAQETPAPQKPQPFKYTHPDVLFRPGGSNSLLRKSDTRLFSI